VGAVYADATPRDPVTGANPQAATAGPPVPARRGDAGARANHRRGGAREPQPTPLHALAGDTAVVQGSAYAGGGLTPAEYEARRQTVAQLVALGVTPSQLRRALADQGYPVSDAVARREHREVLHAFQQEIAEREPFFRAAQIQRLESDLARWRRDGKWQAVVQTEALLSRIAGTTAPTRVDVRVAAHVVVREALVEVVSSLSEAELDALAAEASGDPPQLGS